jgi:hypothetical protein
MVNGFDLKSVRWFGQADAPQGLMTTFEGQSEQRRIRPLNREWQKLSGLDNRLL